MTVLSQLTPQMTVSMRQTGYLQVTKWKHKMAFSSQCNGGTLIVNGETEITESGPGAGGGPGGF